MRHDIGGDKARVGAFVGDGACDAARPRADVGDKQRARLCGGGERGGISVGGGLVLPARPIGAAVQVVVNCLLGKLDNLGVFALFGLRRLGRRRFGGYEHVAFPRVDGAVERHALFCGRQQRERLADQRFGFGARDEHPGTHLHRDVAKRRFAGDVLQGLSPAAARDVAAQHVALFHGKRTVEVDVQLDA